MAAARTRALGAPPDACSTSVVPLPANGSRTVAPGASPSLDNTPATKFGRVPWTYGHQRCTGIDSFDRNVIGPEYPVQLDAVLLPEPVDKLHRVGKVLTGLEVLEVAQHPETPAHAEHFPVAPQPGEGRLHPQRCIVEPGGDLSNGRPDRPGVREDRPERDRELLARRSHGAPRRRGVMRAKGHAPSRAGPSPPSTARPERPALAAACGGAGCRAVRPTQSRGGRGRAFRARRPGRATARAGSAIGEGRAARDRRIQEPLPRRARQSGGAVGPGCGGGGAARDSDASVPSRGPW